MRALINTMLAILGTTTTAFAANGGQAEEPGILCWAFIGFCAVIFVAQLIPAAMLLIGAAKAIAAKPDEAKTKA